MPIYTMTPPLLAMIVALLSGVLAETTLRRRFRQKAMSLLGRSSLPFDPLDATHRDLEATKFKFLIEGSFSYTAVPEDVCESWSYHCGDYVFLCDVAKNETSCNEASLESKFEPEFIEGSDADCATLYELAMSDVWCSPDRTEYLCPPPGQDRPAHGLTHWTMHGCVHNETKLCSQKKSCFDGEEEEYLIAKAILAIRRPTEAPTEEGYEPTVEELEASKEQEEDLHVVEESCGCQELEYVGFTQHNRRLNSDALEDAFKQDMAPSPAVQMPIAPLPIPASTQMEHMNALQSARRARFSPHLIDHSSFDIRPFLYDDAESDVDLSRISLTTHLGFDETKLTRLLDTASRWEGYISAVIYIDSRHSDMKTEAYALRHLAEFRAEHSSLFQSKVSIHVVIDRRVPNDEDLYPHNLLRNLAIDYAWTDSIAMVDADFIPSMGSHQQLQIRAQDLAIQSSLRVVILPSFQRELKANEATQDVTFQDLPATKADLMEIVSEFVASRDFRDSPFKPFHLSYFPGHGPTDFLRWFQTSNEYRVDYQLYFEPYFVVHRTEDLPLFWEHFSGFGRNKQAWVEEMALAGYQFHVDPDAFLVHINHDYSKQDLRTPRPFVVHEYAGPFQTYMKTKYQDTFWDDLELKESIDVQTNIYYRKALHFCKSSTLVFNSPADDTGGVNGADQQPQEAMKQVDIPYQCKGKQYNEFAERLFDYVKAGGLEAHAGTRRFPLPSDSTVLVLGNSHTQQLVDTMVCQYNSLVKEAVVLEASSFSTGQERVFEVVFKNNARLINLAGNPALTSRDGWQDSIQILTDRLLDSYDAILLGNLREEANVPGDDLSVSDVSSVFQGPVVFVGASPVALSAAGAASEMKLEEATQRSLTVVESRSNVESLNTWQHVPVVGECVTNDPTKSRICDEQSSVSQGEEVAHMESIHRCVGRRGGSPDLLSWQVIEFFHRHMTSPDLS